MEQSRFRSKVAWTSVLALIVFIVKNYTNIEIPEIDKLVELILVVATALGIFNNPTTTDKF